MNDEDLIIRRHILNLMCQLKTEWDDTNFVPELETSLEQLNEMEEDGLVELHNNKIINTEKGKAFTRNVAMTFDLRMLRNKPETRIFSMTV